MSRHTTVRRAALLLVILAAAFLWAADQGIRAAANDRADKSAMPTKSADKAVTGATAKAATPAKTADKAVTGTTVKDPVPATTAAAAAQSGNATGKITRDKVYVEKFKKMAPSVQKEAARQARLRGLKPGVAGLAKVGIAAAATPLPGMEGPGGIPHYFGPYANWAFSPLPKGPVTAITILAPGTGYTNPIIVIDDAYGTGTSIVIPATAVAGAVQPPTTGLPAGADFTAPVATIVDDPALCGAALQPACGTGALADAIIGGAVTGGMRKFVDLLPGIPGVSSYVTAANGYDATTGANNLGQYLTLATPQGWPLGCTTACTADYYEIALVEYTEQMHSDLPGPCTTDTAGVTTCGGTTPGTSLRGYVQLSTTAVPGLQIPLVNPNGTPIMMPDGVTQAKGVDKPHYLGPSILATGRVAGAGIEARPVRIKFHNLLPNGAAGGNLLLPVDKTVPGSGVGPVPPAEYSQNRATIHLHGNNTVWISDGNTHQWITPATETTPYPAGVSARNVPDMGDGCDVIAGTRLPGNPATSKSSGCMTFYYTNAQSARLQFYHDHAHGITRLNVYAGEAAGYVVTDAVETDMMMGTNVTGIYGAGTGPFTPVLPDIGIPLIIQDKTWVDANTIYAQDPTWAWGSAAPGTAVTGDLWYPHVYMVVSNPYDPTGTNPFGKWFYGPWFNPPTPVCSGGLPVGCIEVGLVPNEYANPANPGYSWLEPPMRPGTPNPSIPGESFLDTPIVNGTAYPVLKLEPKAYRFRILNAANDRAQNLQLYVAADKTADTTATALTPAPLCDGTVTNLANCTEVRMVPVSVLPANQFADTPSGIPDPVTAGPPWIQIGTEGGFMPEPVVVPQQPIGFNMNTGQFNFGIVNQHSLYLMAAERADVIVDFSQFGGKTLILYNDAPAPVPAGAAVYDFYTGDGNLMDSGGAPNTLPGYGPNTRTIMQIQVAGAPAGTYNLAALQAVFAKTIGKRGVFEVSQDPILIPQAAYNSAYNLTFPSDASQFVLSPGDLAKTFQPLGYDSAADAWTLKPAVTIPFEMKAMHDEMGGVYDTGFGRMSGMLGLTNPSSALGFILPFPFSSPPTDVVKGSLESTKIGELADGTQLWRIFHNGVDTHPIHTHLFTAQVISRVGQDGQVASNALAVDTSDLGWKDTFKVNPLEITFLALRPTVPTPSQIPFTLPNSVRLIDPTLPDGAPLPPPGPAGWFDPNGNPIDPLLNHTVNFGWEYVWHCHILSHEEMDFMHSLVFAVPPNAPTGLTVTRLTSPTRGHLVWTNNSASTVQFRVERAETADFTRNLKQIIIPYTGAPNPQTYDDTGLPNNRSYWYRVWAVGAVVGDTATPGFPTMSAESVSNTVQLTVGTTAIPLAPTNLIATALPGPQVSLTWTDNATNETGFVLERCSVVSPATCTTGSIFALLAAPGPRNSTGSVTYVDATVAAGNTYMYRVMAVNGTASSAYAYSLNVPVIAPPAPPTSFTVSPTTGLDYQLQWTASADATNYTIQWASNATFTKGVSSETVVGSPITRTLKAKTTYYYRIRANNAYGSSEWTNGSPFPVQTP